MMTTNDELLIFRADGVDLIREDGLATSDPLAHQGSAHLGRSIKNIKGIKGFQWRIQTIAYSISTNLYSV
jgi:hypothetical protein